MTPEPDKMVCQECGARVHTDEMLTAPHPFLSDDTIIGCPKCREARCLETACDEPGCWGWCRTGSRRQRATG